MTYLHLVRYDPLLDKRYRETALGPAVADFLAWMDLGGSAARTLDQYERDLARGCLMYPDLDVTTFSDDAMLHVAKSFSAKQRRVRVAAYRSFFKWARRRRLITSDPTDALPHFKPPAQRIYDLFSDAETELLCGLPVVDGALMRVLFDAGLRKGEARALRLRHFLPEATGLPAGALAVRQGKGSKDRLVPCTSRLSAALNDLALIERLEPDDFLWYFVRANAVTSQRVRRTMIGDGSFDRWWRRCIAAAGVRYRNPHTTRHTFATRALRKGVRLERLSLLMGHSSVRTTFDLYGHLDVADMALDIELLDGPVVLAARTDRTETA